MREHDIFRIGPREIDELNGANILDFDDLARNIRPGTNVIFSHRGEGVDLAGVGQDGSERNNITLPCSGIATEADEDIVYTETFCKSKVYLSNPVGKPCILPRHNAAGFMRKVTYYHWDKKSLV